MNQNYQLCTPWCVWIKFLGDEDANTKEGYNESLKNILTIKTYYDLIYYWQQSTFNDVKKFLVFELDDKNNQQISYNQGGKFKSISAINYFRQGIQPSWQDQSNKTGGRLIFNIEKSYNNYQQIYEWLLFYFLGQSESCAEDINGIRFITTKSNQPFTYYYRVEVWTKFSNVDTAKANLFKDTFVKDFYNQFLEGSQGTKKFLPQFRNNEEKDGKDQAKDKEGGKAKN